MLEEIVVAAIVFGAALYAARVLLPARWWAMLLRRSAPRREPASGCAGCAGSKPR